jgi:hypothetical protein
VTKIPRSITVTVDSKHDGFIVNGESIGSWEIKRAFRKVPETPYKLSYVVSKKGKYLVDDAARSYGSWEPNMGIIIRENKPALSVCFLPPSWHGLRVSRKVEKLPAHRTPAGKKKEGKK